MASFRPGTTADGLDRNAHKRCELFSHTGGKRAEWRCTLCGFHATFLRGLAVHYYQPPGVLRCTRGPCKWIRTFHAKGFGLANRSVACTSHGTPNEVSFRW